MLLVTTFFYSAGSAVAAFLALEAFLAVAAADETYPSVVLAAVAAAGQVTGKLLWYWAGAGTTRLPWLRGKLESPRIAAAMTRWRDGSNRARRWSLAGWETRGCWCTFRPTGSSK